MNENKQSLWGSLAAFVAGLVAQLHAALAVGLERTPAECGEEQSVDPEFEGWLRNDPLVTGSSASRYRSQAPGYLTRNGLGSLEIGAAED